MELLLGEHTGPRRPVCSLLHGRPLEKQDRLLYGHALDGRTGPVIGNGAHQRKFTNEAWLVVPSLIPYSYRATCEYFLFTCFVYVAGGFVANVLNAVFCCIVRTSAQWVTAAHNTIKGNEASFIDDVRTFWRALRGGSN